MTDLLGKIIELKIDSIAYGGSGIGRYNGIACFVPGTIRDELVKVKIITVKKKYLKAKLLEILIQSSKRIKPVCPLTLSPENLEKHHCPGCQYQHIDYQEEISSKTLQYRNLLERFAGINSSDILKTALPSPISYNYRNKITLHTDLEKKILGYCTEKNNKILEINNCPLAHGDINKRLKNFNFNSIINDKPDSIVFRYTKENGAFTYSHKTNNDLLLEEETYIGKLKVPIKSFFQINIKAKELLLKRVIEILKNNPSRYAFDMYCGIGLFAIAAAKNGIPKVYASDIDKKAVHAGKMNANILGCNDIKFVALPAFSAAKSILSTLPPDQTTVILDPPRTGLDNHTINYLSKIKPKNILYISCGADTLSRDLKSFTTSGYYLTESQIIDMFPRTAHFEILSFLTR